MYSGLRRITQTKAAFHSMRYFNKENKNITIGDKTYCSVSSSPHGCDSTNHRNNRNAVFQKNDKSFMDIQENQ